MKKLICAKDVESAAQNGEKTIFIDGNTLITPSARDVAANYGVSFSDAAPACEVKQPEAVVDVKVSEPERAQRTLGGDTIYKAVQILTEKGLLGQLLNALGMEVPYVSESDDSGMLKLVRGKSAKQNPLEEAGCGDKVRYNELVGAGDGCKMNAGFMTIDHSTFSWDVAVQEIYYVIEGTLTVEKDGRVFTATPGDVLFFKQGAHLSFGAPDHVIVFYATL